MSLHYDSIEQLPEHLRKQAKEKLGLGTAEIGTSQQVSSVKSGPMKQNKYHVAAREDRTYRGVVYDSKKEASKAAELDLCVQAGEITFYLRQVPFIVGYDPLTKYVADFVTFDYNGLGMWVVTVIETKGTFAPGAKRKLKLFREKYPNLTLEVC